MKAIVIHELGPPDVLKCEDVPDPQPQAGEIRIRVHAATVNRVLDVSLRAGKETRRAPALPLIPGVDCAGTVDALGPGVARWTVGQHVARSGGDAERRALDEGHGAGRAAERGALPLEGPWIGHLRHPTSAVCPLQAFPLWP